MSLPKIATPTFDLTIPTTGEKIQYRPFKVKEEKILMIAKESGDKADIFNALKQIVNNCVVTEEFDVNKIAMVDMEYIFINLRSKSVSNVVEFQVEDSDDGITYDLVLNLDEVEVSTDPKHDKKIMVNDDVGIMMKYPTPEISDKIINMKSVADITFETINECVDTVFDADDVYSWDGTSEEDKNYFIEEMPVEIFNKIKEFFETAPSIEHIVKYTNSNGKEKMVIFRDLDDFFSLY